MTLALLIHVILLDDSSQPTRSHHLHRQSLMSKDVKGSISSRRLTRDIVSQRLTKRQGSISKDCLSLGLRKLQHSDTSNTWINTSEMRKQAPFGYLAQLGSSQLQSPAYYWDEDIHFDLVYIEPPIFCEFRLISMLML